MQELAEGLVAEFLVVPGVEDELMPQIVDHLGRHRHIALAALEVGHEELAQALGHQLAVLEVQVRVLRAQRFEQPGRQGETADIGFAAQRSQGFLAPPKHRQQHQSKDSRENKRHAGDPSAKKVR